MHPSLSLRKSDSFPGADVAGASSPSAQGKPLKVFFSIASLEMGGAQRLILDLITGMDRARVQPTLVLSKMKGELLPQVPADCRIVDLGRTGREDYPLLIGRMSNLIRRERPDLIFSEMFHANTLALAASRLSRTNVPVVISEHNSVEHYNQGPRWVRGLMRVSYPFADHCVAVSQGVADDLHTRWGVGKPSISVIPNPINVERIRQLAREPLPPEHDQDRFDIVAVGRFTSQKGFSLLLRAIAKIHPEIPVRAVIVGDGPERGQLIRLSQDLGLEKQVVWPGIDDNPYRWMSRSRVFALSSLYEGFGIVILEAMAVGTPVVSFNCQHGPSEIIRHQENGLLIPPADVDGLAGSLREVLSAPALAERLSASAYSSVTGYSIDRITDHYVSVFNRVARHP